MRRTTIRAGAASADITPDPAMTNWITGQPYDGVLDPLHLRALALSDGQGEAILLAWDLIDVFEETCAEVRDAVSSATGVPADRILINASHSHSTPRSPFRSESDGAASFERLARLLDDQRFIDWGARLAGLAAETATRARQSMRRATVSLGRAAVPEWIFNRRPFGPDNQVTTMMVPQDPTVLPDGLSFGPVDPTLTVLCCRDTDGATVATVCHCNCHPVQIYPHHSGLSADYPGFLCRLVSERLGGETLFLQGCAGDQVPARRGVEARAAMAQRLADQAVAAAAAAVVLEPGKLSVARDTVALPLKAEAAERWEDETKEVESQVVAVGGLALVTLPGEPLLALSTAVKSRTPFGHTLVLGYSNGYGTSYIGLPGELARGGYEARTACAEDVAGRMLVELAERVMLRAAADLAG